MDLLEILKFVFQDFYHWFGTLILLCAPLAVLGEALSRKKEK